MFLEKVVEKVKAHVLFAVIFSENCVFYEIICKNTLEPDRSLMTV